MGINPAEPPGASESASPSVHFEAAIRRKPWPKGASGLQPEGCLTGALGHWALSEHSILRVPGPLGRRDPRSPPASPLGTGSRLAGDPQRVPCWSQPPGLRASMLLGQRQVTRALGLSSLLAAGITPASTRGPDSGGSQHPGRQRGDKIIQAFVVVQALSHWSSLV